jgi:hypothetical protein
MRQRWPWGADVKVVHRVRGRPEGCGDSELTSPHILRPMGCKAAASASCMRERCQSSDSAMVWILWGLQVQVQTPKASISGEAGRTRID